MSGLLSVRRRSRLKCGSASNGAKNLGRTDRLAANHGLTFQPVPANSISPRGPGPVPATQFSAHAFLITDFLHGLSATRASADARMFAPAAIRNTLPHCPNDC